MHSGSQNALNDCVKSMRELIPCQSHEGAYKALYTERRSWTRFKLAKLELGGGPPARPFANQMVGNDFVRCTTCNKSMSLSSALYHQSVKADAAWQSRRCITRPETDE